MYINFRDDSEEGDDVDNSEFWISEWEGELPPYTPPGRVSRFDAPGIEFASNIITVEFGEAVMLRSRTHGSGQTLS